MSTQGEAVPDLTIESPRFTLRTFRAADWQDFQLLGRDWQAAPGPAFDKWPTSDEAAQASVQYMSRCDKYLAMCERASDRVVGLVAFNGIDDQGRLDLGHVVLSSFQDNDRDREVLRAAVDHCLSRAGVCAVVTHNAPEHEAQLAPLYSLGFHGIEGGSAGELTLTRAEWEARR